MDGHKNQKLTTRLFVISRFTRGKPALNSGAVCVIGKLTLVTEALILENFDTSVRPQDDLFRFVNGTWQDNNEIPEDRSNWGSFTKLREDSEHAVRDIITSIEATDDPHSEESMIANLYESFMNQALANELGIKPLQPIFEKIDAIETTEDLAAYLGWSLRHGFGDVVGFGIEVDPGNPTRNVLFAGQSGLSLPDESYYREDQFAEIRTAHEEHIAKMLALAGFDHSADRAARIMALSTEIAKCHWDNVRTRDLNEMYYPQSWEDFKASSASLHWEIFAKAAHLPEVARATVVNGQRTFPGEVAALLTADRLDDWRDWARWMAVTHMASLLSDEFVDEDFRFYSTVLRGIPVQRERWKRGVSLVEGVMGEVIGKEYVKRHFAPEAKAQMEELVANLLEAYRQSISTLDWMGEDTRAEALDKLSKFVYKIGYPNKWRDYSGLEISANDLVGNVIRSSKFDFDYEIAKAGKPVDPEEWEMFPQTVNAYYHPLRNEIVFPAAILQPPFFNPDADDAVNYGGIGAVIGHEIGHGFDDQGSTCDGDGKLRNWWTDADREAFTDRTKALIDQYNVLVPDECPDLHVNGELTIGENIGDLGGLSIAYKAWQIALDGVEPDEIDGFTGAQRLFLSWGAVWNSKIRPDALRERIATDPHSPDKFRCNQTVKNVDAFHEAFDTKPGDGQWLAPEDRVRIW